MQQALEARHFSLPTEHFSPYWKQAGALIAEHGTVVFDLDGVVLDPLGLDAPVPLDADMFAAFRTFEQVGGVLGVATARSDHSVDYLRGHGLQLRGPIILEGGQRVGEQYPFVQPQLREYLRDVGYILSQHPRFQSSWEAVRGRPDVFSRGNKQWQGEVRNTYWSTDESSAHEMHTSIIEPVLQTLAPRYGLLYEYDVSVGISPMRDGPTIIRITGKHEGEAVHKGIAVRAVPEEIRWTFVADGPGDEKFAVLTRARGGGVVSVGKTTADEVEEANVFRGGANVRLSSPQHFTHALWHASSLLFEEKQKRRIASGILYEMVH